MIMELSLKPGNYINIVGKKSKRYFTFRLIQCLKIIYEFGIWKAEKYVPDMHYYEPDHPFNADFELNVSTQTKARKTRICEIFDFGISKIKFYNGIEE